MEKMICFFLLISFLGFTHIVFSDLFEQKKEWAAQPDTEFDLQGLVLVGHQDLLLNAEQLKEIKGVKVYGVELPESTSAFASELTPFYLHKKYSADTLSQLK